MYWLWMRQLILSTTAGRGLWFEFENRGVFWVLLSRAYTVKTFPVSHSVPQQKGGHKELGIDTAGQLPKGIFQTRGCCAQQ